MNSNIIQISDLNEDEELSISRKKKPKHSHFTMIGDLMKSLDIIANFTKPEAMAFILLKDNRDWKTNYARFSTSSLSKTGKNIFSKGYKLLADKKLVVRVKKGVTSEYMFNPNFIIPNEYEEAKLNWELLHNTAP